MKLEEDEKVQQQVQDDQKDNDKHDEKQNKEWKAKGEDKQKHEKD